MIDLTPLRVLEKRLLVALDSEDKAALILSKPDLETLELAVETLVYADSERSMDLSADQIHSIRRLLVGIQQLKAQAYSP